MHSKYFRNSQNVQKPRLSASCDVSAKYSQDYMVLGYGKNTTAQLKAYDRIPRDARR